MDKKKYQKMKVKFIRQRCNARRRKIEWLFTFEEWIDKWEQSGKWEQRGRKKDQYVMCRFNDEGPYSYDNTRIDTCNNNNVEANKTKYKNHVYKVKVKSQRGRGRPQDSGKSVTINGVTYPTVTKASKELKVPRTTLNYRLQTGYYD